MKIILFIFIFIYLFSAFKSFYSTEMVESLKTLPEWKDIKNSLLDLQIDPNTVLKIIQWISLILQILFVIIILICCK